MSEVLKKFGRYFLLDHIAQGGMAEIYRARLASVDGAGRLIVIKRIQPAYGANAEFLQMFRAEIKVTMGFNHANIAQLYDFGEEAQQPFIAMEFVDGRNLRQILTRLNERKLTFPVEYAAHIVEQAAAGLHYAHSFKDKFTGEALEIVHRDISPQNILVSYEGSVKVIDFGIAKAATNMESTRAGVIKGKPSYLSPEQISGEVLDGRCDVFALGIVLWELLAGKKLFAGDNDLAVLKLIESCQSYVKAPSEINPAVPKELDYIVLRALAKSRDKRFQTAEEFQRALRKFLFNAAPEFNSADLSVFAKELFKDEIVEDRKYIQKLNEKVEQLLFSDQLIASPNPDPTVTLEDVEPREHTVTVVDPRSRGSSASSVYAASKPEEKIDLDLRSAPASAVAQHRASAANFGKPAKPAAAPAPGPASHQGTSPSIKYQTRSIEVHADVAARSIPWKGIASAALIVTAVVFAGPQFLPESIGSKIRGLTGQSHAPARGAVAEADRALSSVPSTTNAGATSVKTMVQLKFNILPSPAGAQITVNGKTVTGERLAIDVPADEPLELVVQKTGYASFRREFVIESRNLGSAKEFPMEVQLEPTRFGFLTIYTTPSADATLMIDGKPWTRKTPFEREKLPSGTYNVKLSNELLGMEKTITVTIQDGRVAAVTDERLEIKN
jgi:serine/threonine-protein kinase